MGSFCINIANIITPSEKMSALKPLKNIDDHSDCSGDLYSDVPRQCERVNLFSLSLSALPKSMRANLIQVVTMMFSSFRSRCATSHRS